MNSKPGMSVLMRRPTAFVPMLMSLAAFAVVASYIVIYGVARESDEGAAVHIWQLLVCAQFPLVALFVFNWLPKAPQAAMRVLLMQSGAFLVAAAPVFFLHL